MTTIAFYENHQHKLWFTNEYAELTLGKIIFSSDNKKVEDFNRKSVDELKPLVRSFLPVGVLGSENHTILYVPFDMKDKFIKILEYLGFKTKKGNAADVPTSEKLGLVKGDVRSSFYDSMTIKDVHVLTEVNNMKNAEVQKLFDEITSEDTNIDAVFLARTGNSPQPILPTKSVRDGINIKVENYKLQVQKFLEYVARAKTVTPGFQDAYFRFTPALISIVLLGENQKILLFFVNATGEDFANFDFNRDQYLPKIKELLIEAKMIDEIN